MRRWLKRLALASLALTLVPMGACQMVMFTISIPDFASKAVDGVWLWRLSPATGQYARDTQFVFGELVPGTKKLDSLDYQAQNIDGTQPLSMQTYVNRSPANPDQVNVQLIFTRGDVAGYYRASTYNTTGDSPLSSEIVPL